MKCVDCDKPIPTPTTDPFRCPACRPKHGGPAFPSPTANTVQDGQLSVRDYFAGREMSWPPLSWWQARCGSGLESVSELKGVDFSEGLAAWRYQVADAMLAERAK